MLRRRLRLSYSSDEEEQQPPPPPPPPPQQHHQSEEEEPQLRSPTVTHPPVTRAPPYPYPSEPLPITSSSDEFIDVSDNFSSPSPPPAPEIESNYRPLSPRPVPEIDSNYRPPSPPPAPEIDFNYRPPSPSPAPEIESNYRLQSPPPAPEIQSNYRPPSPPPAPTLEPDYRRPSLPQAPAPVPEPDYRPPSHPPSSGGCPMSDYLQGLGLRLKREWVDACVQGLQQSVPGFQNLDVETKAKLCFEQFLVSDMNRSGGRVLPENVASLHLVDLPGPYVLQVDEIVNISNPLKTRYQKANVGLKRCLKLSMTDGVQRVFAMEYRPIQALEALAPAGLKVAICNVHMRHGLLMLVPECVEVLGGLVEELDAARQRLVDEVNKPPRGNRTRNGVVPPLATRLALAAWPPNGVHAAGHTNNSTMEASSPFQAPDQGSTFSASARNISSASSRNTSSVSGRNTSPATAEESTVPLSGEHSAVNPSSTDVFGVEEMPMDATPYSRVNAIPNPLPDDFGVENLHINSVRRSRENRVPENAIANPSFEDALGVEDIEMDAVHFGRENHASDAMLNDEDIDMDHMVDEGETGGPYPSSDAILNHEDIDVVNEVDHPPILSGDREPPFSYIASLSTKLAKMQNTHSVQGKVKCVLTGVKGFQYARTYYELQAYVDDGTLISEILIDHSVVRKGIGHSPEEVRASLSSPDKTIVRNMKEKMKQFQKFLTNFEGIILIEMRLHELPIALEMKQGCTRSDAWLLLRRLKTSSPARRSGHASPAAPTSHHASPPARTSHHLSSHPIEVSP